MPLAPDLERKIAEIKEARLSKVTIDSKDPNHITVSYGESLAADFRSTSESNQFYLDEKYKKN